MTLGGLLIGEGVMIHVPNSDKSAVGGVISVSPSSPIYHLVNNNISVAAGWIVLAAVLGLYAAVTLAQAARLRAQGLSAPPLSIALLTILAAAMAASCSCTSAASTA